MCATRISVLCIEFAAMLTSALLCCLLIRLLSLFCKQNTKIWFVSAQYGRISSGQAERGHPADGRGDNLHWYGAPCSDIYYFCFNGHSVGRVQICVSF